MADRLREVLEHVLDDLQVAKKALRRAEINAQTVARELGRRDERALQDRPKQYRLREADNDD